MVGQLRVELFNFDVFKEPIKNLVWDDEGEPKGNRKHLKMKLDANIKRIGICNIMQLPYIYILNNLISNVPDSNKKY